MRHATPSFFPALPILLGGLLLASLVPTLAIAAEKAEAGSAPQAEFALLAGMALRSASSDQNVNPDGIGYDPAHQLSFQARGYVWSWLNAAIYHRRASHGVNLPRGAAGMDYQQIEIKKILTYSLGARIEPTLRLNDELRAWLAVGVGWGRANLGKVTVHEQNRSYTVSDRAGVFVEVPLSIGATYEILPRWLAIQAEADVAPLSMQSGKLYEDTPYVDSQGTLDVVGPMPTQTVSASFLLGVSLLL